MKLTKIRFLDFYSKINSYNIWVEVNALEAIYVTKDQTI